MLIDLVKELRAMLCIRKFIEDSSCLEQKNMLGNRNINLSYESNLCVFQYH